MHGTFNIHYIIFIFMFIVRRSNGFICDRLEILILVLSVRYKQTLELNLACEENKRNDI